jgi:hypothetical protein
VAQRPPCERSTDFRGRQSQPLSSRRELDTAIDEQARRVHADPDIVAPNWQLFIVMPHEVEFWQAPKTGCITGSYIGGKSLAGCASGSGREPKTRAGAIRRKISKNLNLTPCNPPRHVSYPGFT